jgi:hypothetical protein
VGESLLVSEGQSVNLNGVMEERKLKEGSPGVLVLVVSEILVVGAGEVLMETGAGCVCVFCRA